MIESRALPLTDEAVHRELSGLLGKPVEMLSRRPGSGSGTARIEIATCRLPDGDVLALHCKAELEEPDPPQSHRRGVVHEAEVHKSVLSVLPVTTPRFYGAYRGGRGEWILVTEYVDGALHISEDPAPGSMQRAAEWLARFHALTESPDAPGKRSLRIYDMDFYAELVDRLKRLAVAVHARFPWFRPVLGAFQEEASILCEDPVVIHNEFYPKNVLSRDRVIYPVDWESAAVGPAEIDLAAHTERWPPGVIAACRDAYVRARWGGRPPAGFDRRLGLARLYSWLRWLSYWPEAAARGELRSPLWFDMARSAGERLGWL